MDRRKFLQNTTMLAISGGVAGLSPLNAAWKKPPVEETPKGPRIAASLKYRSDGKFKILQLTDTHVIAGDPRSERAIQNINAVLDAEKPDFVIHTGDIIYGTPADASVRMVFQPLMNRGIPFAVVLGNHDEEFDLSRAEIYEVVRSFAGNVNTPADTSLNGFSNDILTLSGAAGPDRVFYLFDTGNRTPLVSGLKSWDYVHSDQIEWYRRASAFFTAGNGGVPIPSLAFFHIPFDEYLTALHEGRWKGLSMKGNLGETPSRKFNSGLYVAMREMGDVQATVAGHDHNNDFALLWQGFFFLYGRFSGCDIVYNDLKPNGARVFEFSEGNDGFRTWIRLSDGRIEQELCLFPGMKSLSDKR